MWLKFQEDKTHNFFVVKENIVNMSFFKLNK